MRIGRTIPPAAAPLDLVDLWFGARGLVASAPAIQRFEDELRRSCRTRHVFTLSSGAAALTVTLKAIASISDRAEVILPAYTCFTVPAAVVQAGLQPVLCDIDPSTFELDQQQLERLVSRRTLCVIAHHLFGIPSDVDRVRAICETHGVLVVEDAAQGMGVETGGRRLGTLGDVGIFSLGRGKQATCGEGGVILTSRDRLAKAIERQYRDVPAPGLVRALKGLITVAVMCLCIRPWLYWFPSSLPFLRLGETIFPTHIAVRRLSGMHAGLMRRLRIRLLRAQRGRVETGVDFRRRLQIGSSRDARDHAYLRLPVYAATVEDKTRLCAVSQQRGLGIAPGYPTAVNEIPELRGRFKGERFPRAKRVADHLLTIPTHHWLIEQDKQAIVDSIVGVVSTSCPPEEAVDQLVVERDSRAERLGLRMTTSGIEGEGA